MTSSELLILIAVLTIGVLIFRKFQSRHLSSEREQELRARQVEIQSVLDGLGAILKNRSTTLEVGNLAAAQALEQLNRLNPDGSLKELIADTEIFVEEWRASQRPA